MIIIRLSVSTASFHKSSRILNFIFTTKQQNLNFCIILCFDDDINLFDACIKFVLIF